jgi:hypothetical protein
VRPVFFEKQAAKGLLEPQKIKMHGPKLTYNHVNKDLLLQCMHEAAVEHDTLEFLDFIAMPRKSIVKISLNRCGMVGIGPGASRAKEN